MSSVTSRAPSQGGSTKGLKAAGDTSKKNAAVPIQPTPPTTDDESQHSDDGLTDEEGGRETDNGMSEPNSTMNGRYAGSKGAPGGGAGKGKSGSYVGGKAPSAPSGKGKSGSGAGGTTKQIGGGKQRVGAGGRSVKKHESMGKRLGLTFSVSRLSRFLRAGRYAKRVGVGAAVYLASTLDYLMAEMIVIAAEKAKESKMQRIKPRHVQLAIRDDIEFSQMLSNVVISDGGVKPGILGPLLVRPKKKFGKEDERPGSKSTTKHTKASGKPGSDGKPGASQSSQGANMEDDEEDDDEEDRNSIGNEEEDHSGDEGDESMDDGDRTTTTGKAKGGTESQEY